MGESKIEQKIFWGGDEGINTMPIFSGTAPRVKEDVFKPTTPQKQLAFLCEICGGTGKRIVSVRSGRRIVDREVVCPCKINELENGGDNDIQIQENQA